MKIWIDQPPTNSPLYANKGGIYQDCDCDCGDCDLHDKMQPGYKFAALNFAAGSSQHLMNLPKLHQTSTLHIQACGDARWLACNPVGSGTVVVLDAPALSLLESFGSPTTLSSLLARQDTLFIRRCFLTPCASKLCAC
jgi:hypothetical protein